MRLGGPSLPLDIGYSETVPAGIRNAVILRDKRCRWACGCNQPAAACEVHHVKHKANGGKTSTKECVLLCFYHHQVMIHRQGWTLVLNPDGTTTAWNKTARRCCTATDRPPVRGKYWTQPGTSTGYVGFFGGVADKVVAQTEIQQAAAVNTPENFRLVLARAFEQQVVDQMSVAQEIALRFMDDAGLRDEIISELLGPDRESMHLEYKPSLRTLVSGQVSKPRETQILRTIAAFSNSRDGGTLLIGVTDAGVPCGLAGDYASLRRHGKNDRDVFQLHLINIVVSSMGAAAAANVSAQFHTIDFADVCLVHVQPSALPVDAKVSTEKNVSCTRRPPFTCASATAPTSSARPRRRSIFSTAGPPPHTRSEPGPALDRGSMPPPGRTSRN